MYNQNKKGFTLIELLIVIGIIAILAAAVIITVTPGQKLKDARESTRLSHFANIGNAAHVKVITDDDFSSIHSITNHADCGSLAVNTYGNLIASCATLMGLGTLPEDPVSAANYQIKATTTQVDGQLMITTTATESNYKVGGTPGPKTY